MRYPRTVDESWRTIRALRHSPPGRATAGDGKLLFSAATEQSEQFFRLSDQAGHETKPILLYYGLNQFYRAVRATIEDPHDGSATWTPRGHGLSCPNLEHVTSAGDLVVRALPRGSFQKLAECVDSVAFSGEVPLRELWASTLEGAEVLLQGSDEIWCCAELDMSGYGYTSTVRTTPEPQVLSAGIFATTSTRIKLTRAPDSRTRGLAGEQVRREVQQRFPDLVDFEPVTQPDGRVSNVRRPRSRRSDLPLAHSTGTMPLGSDGLVSDIGDQTYRGLLGRIWLVPTVGDNFQPMQPLLSWWSVLFPLSMLARYQPSGWSRMLDVDNSADATAMEYVLSEAHHVCVNLMAHLLEEFHTSNSRGSNL